MKKKQMRRNLKRNNNEKSYNVENKRELKYY